MRVCVGEEMRPANKMNACVDKMKGIVVHCVKEERISS